MKKTLLVLLIILIIAGITGAWVLLGPATGFKEKKKALYIGSRAANKQAVLDSLQKNQLVKNPSLFDFLATRMDYWTRIKPGKYEITKGSSLLEIIRRLRNGQQSQVNLVITKIRRKEDLARLVGNRFETDSSDMMLFLNNDDSLRQFGEDQERALTAVLPDTYSFFWTTSPNSIFKKLTEESKKFWTEERLRKAEQMGLTPDQVYILASIVDEETNATSEKGTIASVYLNRVNKGMPLQADPTIRFALNDFTIKRIYGAHLNVASPYNTYRNQGLPPGPICTPSKKTIDAVLGAPSTNYLYFVADSSFNGKHMFSATYEEHLQKAKWYQQAFKRRFSTGQ
ncbi:MAG TPA: endolytic transglycosylase MltG [Chitinophagaceae bacterium]|jgi:UPF0755 protein|nr:endolytic transglycosylase MltG [Chitinophagaceae bacterium]